MRATVVLFGVLSIIALIRPLIVDDIQFGRHGLAYAENVDGSLAGDIDSARTGSFIYQGLPIKIDGQQTVTRYPAVFFTRSVHWGKRYHFIIAPKSGLVLEIEEISDTGDPAASVAVPMHQGSTFQDFTLSNSAHPSSIFARPLPAFLLS